MLSPETERTDLREKQFAYGLIASLKVYVVVSQEKCSLTLLRRRPLASWEAELIEGEDSVLKLPEIEVEIPLARI